MQVAHFVISFNLLNIESWLSNPSEIAPKGDKNRSDEIAEYEITFLPTGPHGFIFFHKKNNEFSNTLGAVDSNVNKHGIEYLEFTWWKGYFALLANGTTVFAATDEEVREILKMGRLKTKSDTLREDWNGIIVNSGIEDMRCSKINRRTSDGYLSLSNSLASVSVTLDGYNSQTLY